jgi:WG containing repeat
MDRPYFLHDRLDLKTRAVTVRAYLGVAALIAVLLAQGAPAQDKATDLTPAGKAILQTTLADDARASSDRSGSGKPLTFPLAICTFHGGLCGAVRRDGSIAVPPRYDWVGAFADGRAAVRLNGLYGFVDEDGREIVTPQYRVVDDYHFGFAQVDIDGKSALIDRDGKMVMPPKYGFIRAVAPDRFRVSEERRLGGWIGGENFSGSRAWFDPSGGVAISGDFDLELPTGVIDMSGQWIEPLKLPWTPSFDQDDPSIRWTQKDKLWGLARADGSWLVEPKFEQADVLVDGLARVKLDGKFGFIDRNGNFVIEPMFSRARSFERRIGKTSAARDGVVGVIDRTGAWVLRTGYQEIFLAATYGKDRIPFGWHFKKADRWGLLDLDGRVVVEADFDQALHRCNDGRLVAYKNKEWLSFKADGSPLQPPDGRLIDATCDGSPPYTMKIGDKLTLVDGNFDPVTPLRFDALVWAGRGIKNGKIDGKWGRIGADGRWLLEPKFDYLSTGIDLFVASLDGKRGFMRADGSWLIAPKFEAARRRDKDTAFVTVAGATGVLRLEDQSWIVPARPGIMCDINHAIMSESAGKRVILSRTGETWIDVGAERVGANLDFGLLTFLRDGKWGLVDTAGQVVIEPQYDDPLYFTSGLRGIAWAKRDGKWCAIDRRGHAIASMPCIDTDPLGGQSRRFQCKVEP